MNRISGNVGLALALGLLSGCGTTRQFVDQPLLTVNPSQKSAREAVGELFGALTPPYNVALCEADVPSRQCRNDSKGVSAKGVGGLLLPLRLHVEGMQVRSQQLADGGLTLRASLDAKVDSIAPLCGTVGARLVTRDNNTASLQFKSFYCNWAVIGNVLVNAEFSIDSIDLQGRVVTGFYKMTFHGTGNAAGSGYYRAVLTPGKTL